MNKTKSSKVAPCTYKEVVKNLEKYSKIYTQEGVAKEIGTSSLEYKQTLSQKLISNLDKICGDMFKLSIDKEQSFEERISDFSKALQSTFSRVSENESFEYKSIHGSSTTCTYREVVENLEVYSEKFFALDFEDVEIHNQLYRHELKLDHPALVNALFYISDDIQTRYQSDLLTKTPLPDMVNHEMYLLKLESISNPDKLFSFSEYIKENVRKGALTSINHQISDFEEKGTPMIIDDKKSIRDFAYQTGNIEKSNKWLSVLSKGGHSASVKRIVQKGMDQDIEGIKKNVNSSWGNQKQSKNCLQQDEANVKLKMFDLEFER